MRLDTYEDFQIWGHQELYPRSEWQPIKVISPLQLLKKTKKAKNTCEGDNSKTAYPIWMKFWGMSAMVKNWLDFRRLPMTTFFSRDGVLLYNRWWCLSVYLCTLFRGVPIGVRQPAYIGTNYNTGVLKPVSRSKVKGLACEAKKVKHACERGN